MLTCIKKVEDIGLFLVGDAGTVVRHFNADHVLLSLRPDPDCRSGGGVFDGIIQQIDQNLHDELGIHRREQKLIGMFEHDLVTGMRGDVSEAFLYDIFHVFHCLLQGAAALQAGHREDVFKLGVQPPCVLDDVFVDLVADALG